MNHAAENPWVDRFILGCAVAAILLMEVFPQLGGWPLLIGVIPWILRIVQRVPVYRRTSFDIPLAIFILTAGVGVWAAYQPQNAWIKFWLLGSAVLLYSAIIRLRKEDLWGLAGFLSLFGIAIALVFLFGWNWEAHPSKVPALNQFMLSWMKIRPNLLNGMTNPNEDDVSGIVGLTLPFMLAYVWRIWRTKSAFLKIVSIPAVGLMLFVLIIATSRGAWLAAAATLGSLGLWFVLKAIFKGKSLHVRAWFVAILVLVGVLSLSVLIQNPGLVIQATNLLPGPAQMESRLELTRNTIELIGDYPFTGGGLAGFPGHYSRYILGTPFYFIGNSHNLFLDSAIEQGILGALALIWIFLGSLWAVLSPQADRSGLDLKYAAMASLLFLIYFGLPENILSTVQSIPLLLIVPGIIVSMTHAPEKGPAAGFNRWKVPALAGTGLILILTILLIRPLQAAWFANLGAVKMARVELASFPSGKWEQSTQIDGMDEAVSLFERSIELNPPNRTANYRLGLLSLQQRDFSNSTKYLETAIQSGPGYYGIRKSLGLSYAWEGKLDSALTLLRSIPEAASEMDAYSWWWGQQGRPDLAENASQLAAALAEGG